MRAIKVLVIVLCIVVTGCIKNETVPPKPQNNGPFLIQGHLIHGTTGEPFNVGERIYLRISWMDWRTISHSEKLGSAIIQEDGSFQLEYPNHKQTLSLTSIVELRSNAFSTYSIPRNQNIVDTFYYSTQAKVRLFADLSSKSQTDTVFLSIPTTTYEHPIFDTITGQYNGFIGEYKMPLMNQKTAINYGFNYSLADKYDSNSIGYSGTDLHKIRTHTIYTSGDPLIDSSYLKIE